MVRRGPAPVAGLLRLAAAAVCAAWLSVCVAAAAPLPFVSRNISISALAATFDQLVSVVSCDLDRDGDMDIVTASYRSYIVNWYENNGRQSFTAYALVTNFRQASSVVCADVNGDGAMDVVTTADAHGRVLVLMNDGARPPTFTTVSLASGLLGVSGLALGDVNRGTLTRR
jgi:hypothetical protein